MALHQSSSSNRPTSVRQLVTAVEACNELGIDGVNASHLSAKLCRSFGLVPQVRTKPYLFSIEEFRAAYELMPPPKKAQPIKKEADNETDLSDPDQLFDAKRFVDELEKEADKRSRGRLGFADHAGRIGLFFCSLDTFRKLPLPVARELVLEFVQKTYKRS